MNQRDEIIRLIRKGRRAEEIGKVAKGCVSSLVTALLVDLLQGWLLMLAIGIAHDHWWPAIPTIGYWWAFLIVLVTPSLFSTAKYKKEGAS